MILSSTIPLASAGCALLQPGLQVNWTSSPRYKPQAAASPERVKVYRLDEPSLRLPEGVLFNSTSPYLDSKIGMEEGYPTPDNPHVLVGKYDVRDAGRFSSTQIIDALVARAAQDGANALVVDFRKNNVEALGIRLSDAVPPKVTIKPAGALLDEEASHPREQGYETLLATEQRRLDAYQPLALDARRGTCYWLTFALAEDAAFSDHARRSLGFDFTSVDFDIDRHAGLPTIEEQAPGTGQLTQSARSGSISIGCPQKSGRLSIDLQATAGSALSKERIHELGSGEIVFRIYTRPIGEEELAKRKQASEKSWTEAEKQRIEYNRRVCRKCANKLVLCGDVDPGSCEPYRDCISRNNGRLDFCLKGL